MDVLSQKEQTIFNYLSIIKSAESLFTLDEQELSTMKKIILEVLEFLLNVTAPKGQNEATSIQIYQIL